MYAYLRVYDYSVGQSNALEIDKKAEKKKKTRRKRKRNAKSTQKDASTFLEGKNGTIVTQMKYKGWYAKEQ